MASSIRRFRYDRPPDAVQRADGHPLGDIAAKRRFVAAPVAPPKVFGHPTVKPDAVMDKIITNVAGLTICDPFMGTGSTGVAAVKAGRVFTGIEHNPKHFETAVRRISAAVTGR